MRFALFGTALFAAAAYAAPAPQDLNEISTVTGIADVSSDASAVEALVPRQQHPGGPGRTALINLLGKPLYNEISHVVHTVGIDAAHTEQEINQLVTALNPDLGNALHKLLSAVSTLEADLVSIGFNT